MATKIPFQENTQVRSRGFGGRVRRQNTPDLIGGGTGREATQRAAKDLSGLGDLALRKQERDNLDSILTADTLYKRVEAAKIRSLTEAKGSQARGLLDRATAWYDGNTNVTGEQATPEEVEYQNFYGSMSDDQKSRFDSKRGQRKVGLRDTIAKHQSAEEQAALKDAFIANNEASLNSAMVEYNDPGAVVQSKFDIQKNIAAYGQSVGWGADQVESEVRRQMGIFHTGIVNSFLAGGDTAGAEAYFKANSGKANQVTMIPGADRPALKAKIQSRATLGKSQSAFDKIRIGKDPDEWLAEAEKIKDPEVRAQTEGLVRRDLADQKQAGIDKELNASLEIYNEYILKDARSIADIPQHLWDALPQTKQQSFAALIEKSGPNKDIKTDTNVYGKLTEMMSTPGTQKDFLNEDITGTYGQFLSRADIKHFEDAKAKIRLGEENFTGPQKMNDIFKDYGWNTEGKAELRNEAIIRVDKFARQEEAKTGKPLTDQRFDEIVKGVMNNRFVFQMEAAFAKSEKAGDPPKDTVTLTQQINTGLAQISKGLTSEEQRVRKGLTTSAINERILSAETLAGRKLRDEERVVVVDTVLTDKVFVDDFGFDSEMLMSEVPEDELKDVYVEVGGEKVTLEEIENFMSPEIENQIFHDLKALGRPLTLQNIADQIGVLKRDAAQGEVIDDIELRNFNPALFDSMKATGMDKATIRQVMENLGAGK